MPLLMPGAGWRDYMLAVRWLLVCLIPACLACLLTLAALAAPPAAADREGIHKRTAVDVKPIERRFTQPATPPAAQKTVAGEFCARHP